MDVLDVNWKAVAEVMKKYLFVKFFNGFLMNLRNKEQMILIGTNIIIIDINIAVKLSFRLILLRCTYFNNLS